MENLFDCDRCGLCCRSLGKNFIRVELDRGDGVCKNFNEETRLCKIYKTRPIVCNVDAYYEKFLSDSMSREKFHELNREICNKLKEDFQTE